MTSGFKNGDIRDSGKGALNTRGALAKNAPIKKVVHRLNSAQRGTTGGDEAEWNALEAL